MSWKGWDALTISDQEDRIQALEEINAEMLETLEWIASYIPGRAVRFVWDEKVLAAIAKAKGGN